MTEEAEREFKEQMRQDAKEAQYDEEQEARLYHELRTDYDLFMKHYEKEFTDATDALDELKRLHKLHYHDFDCREL